MNNVKKFRKEQGIKATELCREIGISRQGLWKIESGATNTPTLEIAYKIAKALNKSLLDVFPAE